MADESSADIGDYMDVDCDAMDMDADLPSNFSYSGQGPFQQNRGMPANTARRLFRFFL